MHFNTGDRSSAAPPKASSLRMKFRHRRKKLAARITKITTSFLKEYVSGPTARLRRLGKGMWQSDDWHYPSLDSLKHIAYELNVPLVEYFQFREKETIGFCPLISPGLRNGKTRRIRLAVRAVELVAS